MISQQLIKELQQIMESDFGYQLSLSQSESLANMLVSWADISLQIKTNKKAK